jgi:branched-chain amino acid transport system substrate-binding protein
VRVGVARNVIALGSAGLIALGLAACTQSKPQDNGAQPTLQIVALSQIDTNGANIPTPPGASPASPAGDGKATCRPVSLAFAGALTGANNALGINIRNGAQLAIDQHNAANPGCQVQFKPFDTSGDPQTATSVAPRIVDDQFTIGLIGMVFSGETKATGAVFEQAGMAEVSPSATSAALTDNGWKTFFRGVANDSVQAQSVANYFKNTLKAQKVCVVDDSTDYGLPLATSIRQALGPVANADCTISVKQGDKEFSAAVNQIKGAKPDAIYYAGYYAGAAPFVQQLRDGGVTATFVGSDGVKDPEFIKEAGAATKGSILTCPCGPTVGTFADDYNKKYGKTPGTYSAEGYDIATLLLKGIDSGASTRAGLLQFVKNYNGEGVARHYQWTNKGELTSSLIWTYKVQ